LFLNNSKIKFVNKVHEVLEGYSNFAPLPKEPEIAILHHKTIDRQEKQNDFYTTI